MGAYLGNPLSQNRRNKATYAYILDKVRQKLSVWKSKLLNLAGRVTLAQNCLASIPIYTMQTVWLPASICDELDRITRRFIWSSDQDKKRVHLVSWEVITRPKFEGGLGLRQARWNNIAMLGKLCWDILCNKNKIWVSMLRHKYCDSSRAMVPCNSHASITWKSITHCFDHLEDGFGIRVSNGNSTSLWHDRWLLGKCLAEVVPMIDPRELHAKVSHIINNGRWDLDVLSTIISPASKQMIESTPLPKYVVCEDSVAWIGSQDGSYSAKTGYAWLVNGSSAGSPDPIWRWVWKLKIPQKLKMFLWQILKGRLLTNLERFRRGLFTSPLCGRCLAGEESIIHVLRDCTYARCVWEMLFPTGAPDPFYREEIHGWIMKFLKNFDTLFGLRAPVLFFLCACWTIWQARNDEVINGTTSNKFLQIQKIYGLAMDCNISFPIKEVGFKSPVRLVSWMPPQHGWIKLNMDGSSMGNPGRAGRGGILRDAVGRWLGGFSMSVGVTTNMVAELLAIRRGMKIAWDKGFRAIIVESDSLEALRLIGKKLGSAHPSQVLVGDIQALQQRHWEVKFQHVLREGNACADYLAKIGATSAGSEIFLQTPPIGIRNLLDADNYGVMHPRL